MFDEGGKLLKTVEMPRTFEPHVITSSKLYGFLELPTGEIAIAVADMPPG